MSTFAAFFTRAFDQIRMSQYSDANLKFIDSHAGVSIGGRRCRWDSKMSRMFRSVPGGGLGEAVLQALADQPVALTMLAVNKTTMSGTGDELRDFAGISAAAIVATVQRLVTDGHMAAAVARRRGSGDRS